MKQRLPVILVVVGVIAFAIGITKLFLLRFEAGDVYPPYSSLRADPLGTMALYESLQELPGLTLRRDYSDLNRLPEEKNTTYLHLGAEDFDDLPVELFKEIESFVTRGGRLAITMAPVVRPHRFFVAPVTTTTNSPGTNAPGTKGGPTQKKTSPKKILSDDDSKPPTESVEERWGLAYGHLALDKGDDDVYHFVQVTNVSGLPLPARLDWHSGLILTNLNEAWHPIYARGTNPVVVERRFGRGTIVLATDSFFLSNEAMWNARHPEWIAWFIGPADQVVFDEAHLGVVETSGVAVLMRRYRLYGVIGALAVLAGLFIWKNAVSLVPPHLDEARKDFVTGKDAAGGFVNLLRRNIPPAKILDVCFAEWTKSLTHTGSYTISGVDRASALMEAEHSRSSRDPVKAYQEIARALKSSEFQVPSSKFGTSSQDASENHQQSERNKHDHQTV